MTKIDNSSVKQKSNEIQPRPVSMFTDCFWLLGLIGLIVCNVIQIGPALAKGSATDMMSFQDSKGNRCGVDADVKLFTYTQIPSIDTGNTADSFCVKKCPTSDSDKVETFGGDSPSKATVSVFGKLCVPKGYNLIKFFKEQMAGYEFQKQVADLPVFQMQLPIFLVTALLLTFLYLQVLKNFASILVIAVNWAIIVGLAVFSYFVVAEMIELDVFTVWGYTKDFEWATKADLQLRQACIALAPIQIAFYFLFLRWRIMVSTGIVEAAADAVTDMPSCVLVSVMHLISLLITLALWAVITMTQVSTLVSGKADGSFLYKVDFNQERDFTAYFIGFNLFQWQQFVECFFRFMLSSMFTNWYYFQDGQNDLAGPSGSLAKAMQRTVQSVGTIAIGSFLIAVATIVKLLVWWATYLAGETKADQNFLIRYSLYFVNFIAWIAEKLCEQFSKYGQVHASFTAEDFFSSAWTSMCVNLSNAGIFSTVQIMEFCLVFGGQVSMTIVNLVLAQVILVLDVFGIGLATTAIPTGTFGAIALITFATSSAFLSLFDEAADAIMYCFFFDYDRKGAPPINQPPQLNSFLEQIRKQKEEWDKTQYKNE